MAKPNQLQKRQLGPLVRPFERHNRLQPEQKRTLKLGEGELFSVAIYDATEDGRPDRVITTKLSDRDSANKYIWVITPNGLFIAYEATPGHPNRFRTGLCHSNLTGGKRAYQGGELWFIEGDVIVINFYSGRYGAENKTQEDAVLLYFQSVGYQTVLIDTERV